MQIFRTQLCLIIWAQVSSIILSPPQDTENPRMSPKKPALKMTLEALSLAMAKDLRLKYYEFTTKYSVIFAKHLATETEVTLVNGKLADDNAFTLLQLELEFEICLENRISLQLSIRRTSGCTFRHIHTILQCSTVRLGWW